MNIISSVIAFALSLVTILLFRQADKSSRSIEKAKKYGDRVKDEIEGFVKQRTENLRNAAIELDAKLSQAIAAVNKLDSVYNDFMKKSDMLATLFASIENIEKTAGDAEHTIHTVMDMTALAEKNLARVSKESDFIDSLAKKIAEVHNELAYVSKVIPEMQDTFRKQNEESLQTVSERLNGDFDKTITAFENRVASAQKKSEDLLAVTSIQLNDLYKKAFTEASKKAETLEDATFTRLKEESTDRFDRYKHEFDETTASLEKHITTGLSDLQILLESSKNNWNAESEKFETTMYSKINNVETALNSRIANVQQNMSEIESAVYTKNTQLTDQLGRFDKVAKEKIEEVEKNIDRMLMGITKTADTKFDEYKKQADFYYAKFDTSIAGVTQLSDEMQKAYQTVKDDILQDFGKYTAIIQEKYADFEKHFATQTVQLDEKLNDVTEKLARLREDSYTAVSEKLQTFESDFLAELTRCSDGLTADIEKLQNDVAERLTLMGSESESARKDLEDQYKRELKTRLQQLTEESKTHFTKLKDQVLVIENTLQQRIASSNEELLNYSGQFKAQIEQTKEKVHLHMQNELSSIKLNLQDSLRKQSVEVENGTKEIQLWMENMKQEADDQAEMLRGAFETWKTRNNEQITEAQTLLNEKIVHFAGVTDSAIEKINEKYQAQYKEFSVKGEESIKTAQQKISDLNAKLVTAQETFTSQIREVTDTFNKTADQLTSALDKKNAEATAEASRSLDAIRVVVQNLRSETDQAQHDLFEKLNRESTHLAETIQEIEKHQNAFIAQTRIFERADELKNSLEQDIDKLKAEVSRFEVYRNAMDDLNVQYEKVTQLESEAMQKIAQFMSERKNIELLESEFAKLNVVSASMEKKIVELESANDDLQQYQVKIRRIEESITDVNTRYDRLEKKGTVLNQTVQNIDDAFENLKTLEKDIKSVEGKIDVLPPELDAIREKMDSLLRNQEKADKVRQQLDKLDDLLADMEVRIEKMHTAREWLASTETRLQDISRNSENQLKLLADLQKAEKPAGKSEAGAPPIGTRENVLKLFRSGWKSDAIANALNLSQGEVELILELAEK